MAILDRRVLPVSKVKLVLWDLLVRPAFKASLEWPDLKDHEGLKA
jgi:hypothetical protein